MNEQNTTNQNTSKPTMKIKEALSTQELTTLLRGWLNAIEENKDFEFAIKGQKGTVPQEVLLRNSTKGEYEFKDGEFEFELELKWKDESARVQ